MSSDVIPVELIGVRIELPTNQPIVLLREVGGTRFLPIWIGAGEAAAIAFVLEGVEPQRPLTHDLLRITTEALGATVDRVVITQLQDGIFFADLVFQRKEEVEVIISSRPSDAIALAARTESPIFVNPSVLDEAGVEIQDEDEEAEVERFRDFLEDITPEDFDSIS